jgi:hypothetical protein
MIPHRKEIIIFASDSLHVLQIQNSSVQWDASYQKKKNKLDFVTIFWT